MLLIGLYCLALSALPCADSHSSPCNMSASVLASASLHEHDAKDKPCPPLCACACCGIQIITPAFVWEITVPSLVATDKKISLYPFSLLFRLRMPVWQPPQR